MSMVGFLFFGFIIVSYGVGVWVGMKVKETKSVTKKTTGRNKGNARNRMGLPPRRR